MAKKKKRLGRVVMDIGYVVDLDNSEMCDHAREFFYEDLMNAYKNNEVGTYLTTVEDKTATEGDIPEFLLEE